MISIRMNAPQRRPNRPLRHQTAALMVRSGSPNAMDTRRRIPAVQPDTRRSSARPARARLTRVDRHVGIFSRDPPPENVRRRAVRGRRG